MVCAVLVDCYRLMRCAGVAVCCYLSCDVVVVVLVFVVVALVVPLSCAAGGVYCLLFVVVLVDC